MSSPADPSTSPRKQSKAGRDLPAAIGVGASLVVVVIIGLFFVPLVIVALAALAAAVGTWEVGRSLNHKRGMRIPLVPAVVTGALFPFAAYYGGGGGPVPPTTV